MDMFDYSHLPPQQESTIDQPYLWFDSLIKVDTPHRFKNMFYNDADRLIAEFGGYKEFTEDSFKYFDTKFSTDEEGTTGTYAFFLQAIINTQVIISCDLIDKKIDSCQTEEEVKFILQKLINRLEYLLGLLKERRRLPIREFSSIPMGLYAILKYISKAFNSYLPSPLPNIFCEAESPKLEQFSNLYIPAKETIYIESKDQNITENQSPESDLHLENEKLISESKKSNKKIKSFEWNDNGDKYSLQLYEILVKQKIIVKKETSFETFALAFNGQEIKKPLDIKWHLKSSHNSVKAPIIRLFEFLMNDEYKLLKKINFDCEFAHKIENIFVKEHGEKIKSTQASVLGIGKAKSSLEIVFHKALLALLQKPG